MLCKLDSYLSWYGLIIFYFLIISTFIHLRKVKRERKKVSEEETMEKISKRKNDKGIIQSCVIRI